MKNNRFIFLVIGLFAFIVSQAQSPDKIDFQAMARNASGNPYIGQLIGVQISIIQGSPTGTVVYQEEHSTTTDDYGIFVLPLGEGEPVSGTFAAIDWALGSYYTQVEVDPAGGTNYTDMGTMEMMSVPFALFANRAVYGEDDDADPSNEFQTISESGNVITLSNGGGTVTDNTEDADADPNNELQTISESGNVITLSNGGGTVTDNTEDADADPNNELQTISESGNVITLSNGGGTVTDNTEDADADPANELQNLSVSGNNLSISSGNSVALPSPVWEQNGDTIYYNDGKVGIGTTNPGTYKFRVEIDAASGSERAIALFKNNSTANGSMCNLYVSSGESGSTYLGYIAPSYIHQGGKYRSHSILGNNGKGLVFRTGSEDEGRMAFEFRREVGNSYIYDEKISIDYDGNLGIGEIHPERKLHINGAMRLEPSSTAPANPEEGDIYMDGNSHILKVYNGTVWKSCW